MNYRLIVLIAGLFVLSGCDADPMGILGPKKVPDIKNFNWVDFKVTYYVKVPLNVEIKGDSRIDGDYQAVTRTFVIDDPAELKNGFSHLHIKSSNGSSLPAGDKSVLTRSDGEKWGFHVVFEDRFDFDMRSNNYYAYNVFTSDTEFYDWLRQQCLANEQKKNPHAVIRHIWLRSNASYTATIMQEFNE